MAVVNRIYLNGRLRPDLHVVSVTQRSGLSTPGTAIISAPADRFGADPLERWNTVKIILDARRRRTLAFTGWVWRRVTTEEPGARDTRYECVDGRIHLINTTVKRDYNTQGKMGNEYTLEENLTARAVARDIVAQFNADTGLGFQINTYGISVEDTRRSFSLQGQTVATALDGILESSCSVRRAEFAVQYLDPSLQGVSHGDIRIFIFGQYSGRVRRITAGSRPTRSFKGQPGGRPTAGAMMRGDMVHDIFNRVIVQGHYKLHQKGLALTPAWDTTDEDTIRDVMMDRTRYCAPEINGEVNPWYQAQYKQIGTLYRIAKVSLVDPSTGLAADYTPVIEPFLLQNMGELTGAKVNWSSAVVVKGPRVTSEETYDGDPEGEPVPTSQYYCITAGYTIHQGVFLEFAEPLYSMGVDEVSGELEFTFPEELWLVCTVRDTERLEYDTTKIGDEPYTVTRRMIRPIYHYWDMSEFEIDPETHAVTVLTETEELRDDTARARRYALSLLNAVDAVRRVYSFTLPMFPTSYAVGDRLESNFYQVKGRAIREIEYMCMASGGPVADVNVTAW